MVNRSRPSGSRAPPDTSCAVALPVDSERLAAPDFGPPKDSSLDSIGGGTQSSIWEGDDDFKSFALQMPSTQDTAPNSQATDPPDSAEGSCASLVALGKRKSITSSPQRPTKVPRLDSDQNVFLEVTPNIADPHAPFVVSSNERLESILRAKHVPYGSQWEMAYLLSTGQLKSDEIEIEHVVELGRYKTNASAVPVTAYILSKGRIDAGLNARSTSSPEQLAKLPYAEQDKEEAMLAKNEHAALGFNEDDPSWFGGKIHYTARIKETGSRSNPFTVVLRRPELGVSSQFYRRYGSASFLTVRLSKGISGDRGNGEAIDVFVRRPLIVLGRVFRTVRRADDSFIYFRTNELFVGDSVSPNQTISGAPSFWDFFNAQNPLTHNTAQTMGKWSTRIALGFSTSVPGCVVKKRNVFKTDDVVSKEGSDMTDGAGFMNKATARALRDVAGCRDVPTAAQVRIDGAKGLLILHPDDASEEPRVWLRPSQRKICYADGEQDRSTLIVNLLRTSKTRTVCRLSVETVIIMAENRVKCDAFKALFEESVSSIYEPLLDWDGENAMQRLYAAVNSLGGVVAARAARQDVQRARLHGHVDRHSEVLDDADEETTYEETTDDAVVDGADTPYAIAGWEDPTSGCPAMPAEIVCMMLQAGFRPQECDFLRERLQTFTRTFTSRSIQRMRIDVMHSFSAWIVPDPTSSLQPNEMYFRSSSRDLIGLDGAPTDQVLGPALITRNPCKLPTDVQKWTFVDKPELRHLLDVIVLPVTGKRRPADFLGGGDYDGDKGTVYFDPTLVEHFKNASPCYADEPASLAYEFDSDVEKVTPFLERTSNMTPDERRIELQKFLLPRPHFAVATYSKLHLFSTIKQGTRANESVRFAYKFTKSLDGPKVGVTVKPDVLAKDSRDRKWACRLPAWKEAIDEKEEVNNNNPRCTRPKEIAAKLGPFVMDELHKHSRKLDAERISKIQQFYEALPKSEVDDDLTSPWREAEGRAARMRNEGGASLMEDELERIREHVAQVHREYREEVSGKKSPQKRQSPRKPTSPRKDGSSSFWKMPPEYIQRRLRAHSIKFGSAPLGLLTMSAEEVVRVRASYAYQYAWEPTKKTTKEQTEEQTKDPSFPWRVAMAALCDIKAKARGPTTFTTMTTDFADNMRMRKFASK
ncbi:RNA dependent RNA polymerase-domain-containing protein [Schizophyllum amplum]|uniref:RNA-dependent RNA polymerase n=1 Tax=Schizophyllum amplum TaxID=97359 RepID=A0A550CSH1_9AGAR|nr:RNA dependent RNA polymerase-domain-containing protein [Auriculariopsis ampla]